MLTCWSASADYIQLNQYNRSSLCSITSYSVSCSNRFIQSVDTNAISGLVTISDFSLAYNQIQTIDGKLWQNLTKLVKLDLSYNSFLEFDFIELAYPRSLLILGLRGNSITSLKSFPTIDLRELDLAYNRISVLQPDQFKGLESLRTLDLSHNHINVLPSTSFSSVGSLVTLDLSYNKLSTLDKSTFKSLSQLQKLDLGSNDIYNIEPDTFSFLSSLYDLNLNENQIGSLAPGVLSKNLRVTLNNLGLRLNGLVNVTIVDIFCLNLDSINLCYNNITSVSSSDCNNFRNIKNAWTKSQGITPRSCI